MNVQRIDTATGARLRTEPPRGTAKAGAGGGTAFEVTISDSGVKVGDSLGGVAGSGSPPAVGTTREATAARQVTSRPQFQDLLTAEESRALEESFGPLAAREVSGNSEESGSAPERKAAVYNISGRLARSPDRAPGRLLDLTG